MHDEGTKRSAPSGFLVLERPAAVIGQGAAAEEPGFVRGRLVGEQQHHLAADIRVLVVVPAEFRRDDAPPDVNDLRIERFPSRLALVVSDVFVQRDQRAPRDLQLRSRLRLDFDQRYSLEE